MSLKDEFNKIVDDTKDALHEAGHRNEAAAEKAKRELAGDSFTTTEKAGSVLREAKENVQAHVDHAKRELRDKT